MAGDHVGVVRERAAKRAEEQPAEPRAASALSARRSRGPRRTPQPGSRPSGPAPAYVYGAPFATSTSAAGPCPTTSSFGSRRSRCSASSATTLVTNAALPARRPSERRPRPSTRRITSASNPMPDAKQNLRPFTRPSEIRRVRPPARASATCTAAATGSRGSAERAREDARAAARQEAERESRRRRRSSPRCRCRRRRRRSPRRRCATASAASSTAWPRASVSRVTTLERARAARPRPQPRAPS